MEYRAMQDLPTDRSVVVVLTPDVAIRHAYSQPLITLSHVYKRNRILTKGGLVNRNDCTAWRELEHYEQYGLRSMEYFPTNETWCIGYMVDFNNPEQRGVVPIGIRRGKDNWFVDCVGERHAPSMIIGWLPDCHTMPHSVGVVSTAEQTPLEKQATIFKKLAKATKKVNKLRKKHQAVVLEKRTDSVATEEK